MNDGNYQRKTPSPKGTGGLKLRRRKDGTIAFLMQYMLGGKTYSKTSAAKTRAQAMKELPMFVASVRRGEVQRQHEEAARFSKEPTFGEWAEYWITNCTPADPDRIATKRAYTHALRAHLIPHWATEKVGCVKWEMVNLRMRALYDQGKAVSTIKLTYIVLSMCLDAALTAGHFKKSPLLSFKALKLPECDDLATNAKRNALKSEQIAAFLPALADDPDVDLWVSIMLATSARPGEAAAVRVSNCDVQAGVLHLVGSAKYDAGKTWIGKTKTATSVRSVAIGAVLSGKISAHIERMERIQRMLRGLPDDVRTARPLLPADACLFCQDPSTPEGLRTPEGPRNLRERFKTRVARAGLPKGITPHWLRHTAISHSLAGGAPLAEASRRAGHSNSATTARVYTHVLDEAQQKSAAVGDQLLTISTPAQLANIRTKG